MPALGQSENEVLFPAIFPQVFMEYGIGPYIDVTLQRVDNIPEQSAWGTLTRALRIYSAPLKNGDNFTPASSYELTADSLSIMKFKQTNYDIFLEICVTYLILLQTYSNTCAAILNVILLLVLFFSSTYCKCLIVKVVKCLFLLIYVLFSITYYSYIFCVVVRDTFLSHILLQKSFYFDVPNLSLTF